MNITEIQNTITELENGTTTFDACQKLASLYIVQDRLNNSENTVIKEFNDILPSYNIYCTNKKRYVLGEITEDKFLSSVNALCTEIYEFLHILYISADSVVEHSIISDMLHQLSTL